MTQPYTAMVLGATGNVGGSIVQLLLDAPACEKVVLVVRRSTGTFTHPKIVELVVQMNSLEAEVIARAPHVDLAIAAFGVGAGSAKMSDDEVRTIEVAYPAAFCRAAKQRGARVCALMSAGGANAASSARYLRMMGEKEDAAKAVGFDHLSLFRPGVILGNTNTPGALNAVMPLLDWALPSKYRSVHKDQLARAMVGQAVADWNATAATPTVKILEYAEMKPHFTYQSS